MALGVTVAALGALSVLTWLWVQSAALLSSGRLLGLGLVDAGSGLVALVRGGHWGDPASAFAGSVSAALPGAVGMYVVAAVWLGWLGFAVGVVAGRVRAWGRVSPESFRRFSLPWLLYERGWLTQRTMGASFDLDRLTVSGPTVERVTVGTYGRRRRLVACEPEIQPMVLASPRAGKTRYVVRLALHEWWGPVMATSTKLDLLDAARVRAQRGGRSWVLDPFNPEQNTCFYDPLHACTGWEESLRVAASYVGVVDSDTAGNGNAGGGNARFFRQQAELLLAPLFYAAGRQGAGMGQVISWLDSRQWQGAEVALAGADHGDQARAQLRSQTEAADPKTTGNILMTAIGLLAAYRHPKMQASAAVDPEARFTPDQLLEGENNVLLIVASDQDQAILAPAICALVADVYRTAIRHARAHGRLELPLLMALDELANIAPIQDLPRWLAQCGDAGVTILHVWQSLAQMALRYGTTGRDAILGASTAQLFLSPLTDPETQRYLSEGSLDAAVVSESQGPQGRSSAVTHRPGLERGQVRRLPAGKALLRYRELPDTVVDLRGEPAGQAHPRRASSWRWSGRGG